MFWQGLITRFNAAPKQDRPWGQKRAIQPVDLLPMAGEPEEPTSSAGFYPRLQRFLQPTDLLVSDTGTCLLKLNAMRLPAGVSMESQTLWASIGWGNSCSPGMRPR